jgi:hypothetical protein
MSEQISNEEAARQLRVWRVEQRSKASISDLETETGIPARRIKNLLLKRDALPEYREHILRFLQAFREGDQESLAQLRGEQPPILPAPHKTFDYLPHHWSAIKTRQHAMTRREDRPYCLIGQREISPFQCVANQNSRDCFGCAAATRFCAECGFDSIAFPGSELCDLCLTKALQDPDLDAIQDSWVVHVKCPIMAKSITAATCKRMQGDACGSCNAITRICQECKVRRVRYPASGLCLRCNVNAWNSLWKPLSEEKISRVEEERRQWFDHIKEEKVETAPEPLLIIEEPTSEVQVVASVDPDAHSLLLLSAISQVWATIRMHHAEVPSIMLIPSVYTRQRQRRSNTSFGGFKWGVGETSDRRMVHEVFVYINLMGGDPESVVADLLHEAAHAINHGRGVMDVAQTSQYHNGVFRDTAIEVGLEVEQVKHYGYAITRLAEPTRELYAEAINNLPACLPRREDPDKSLDESYTPRTRLLKASCPCGFIIRLSRTTIYSTGIRCDTCGLPFQLS